LKFVELGLFADYVIVNEDACDVDFRVESQTNTHCLFVDASTGTVTTSETLDVNDVTVNSATTESVTLTFGGGGSGDCNSITFTSGLITTYTTVP